jgi:tRNA G18 (ribose-2'-O)-methylase SpoU
VISPIAVADPDDERVADFVGLTDPALRRLRELSGGADGAYFIAEGEVVIRQLLRSSYRVRSFLLTPPRLAALQPDLAGVEAPVYVAAQPLMDAIAGFHLHRGALASADRPPLPDPALVAAESDLLVVVEGVNDHENLGAIFRNAAAFGAGGVILDPTACDPLYRRSVRVSAGQVLRMPFTRATKWPGALAELRALGMELLALTPAPDADDVRLLEPGPSLPALRGRSGPSLPAPRGRSGPRRALLVGAEGPGLSGAAQAMADRRVRIAMAPGVDSLNVGAATAVALHHLANL